MAQSAKTIWKWSKNSLNEKEKELIQKAFTFAEKAHVGQTRDSGEPYFNHLFETAKNLAAWGMNAPTIAAGLLHDTIEDTATTENDIRKNFGAEIAFLVRGVTKIGLLKYSSVRRHIETLQKLFLASAEDVRVIIIKLADRIHNVQTLEYKTLHKQKKIALETMEIYAALANRLGMRNVKDELEDASFRYILPKEYRKTESFLKIQSPAIRTRLETTARILRKILRARKVNFTKIEIEESSIYSLYKKLKQNKHAATYAMSDLAALRIIVPRSEDCYKVLGVIHSLYKPLPTTIKDYISTPQPNGYQSIHTTVFLGEKNEIAEMRISTYDMYEEARDGILFFLSSAKKPAKKEHLHKKIEWIHGFKNLRQITAEPKIFFDTLKNDFFHHRIHVFTPQCKMVDLPEGSSSIDFAYALYPRLGNRASQAKINGKISPLETKLENGDMVEIIVNRHAHPSSNWLNFSKTIVAKKHIHMYLQHHSRPRKKTRVKTFPSASGSLLS